MSVLPTLIALLLAVPLMGATTTGLTPALHFGIDADGVAAMTSAGAKPDLATIWIGPWNLAHGWKQPDAQLATLRDTGVTPAVHLYYWGDDLSPACFGKGCWSTLHDAWKDQAGWQRLTQQLADHLNATMAGRPVMVLVETEFNKGSVATYEPLDAALAAKEQWLHRAYPHAQVVLPFGNWNSASWSTFDRAAAASDAVGLQGMRGSTRDTITSATGLYQATYDGAKRMQALFHKPIVLQDLAVSSYPEPAWLSVQKATMDAFMAHRDELRAVGVTTIVYRSWNDHAMDPANYFGAAESHWGLASGGSGKPAAAGWLQGIRSERAAHAFAATFSPRSVGNDWWVEAAVTGTGPVARVEASVNGGAWTRLPADAWGTYAASLHAPDGSTVALRATDSLGRTSASRTYVW